jgi:ribulose-5-phosphate 4-epimerase/fuculose-1-phosphate aldolase
VTTAVKPADRATGATAVDPREWELRVELASCYRLFDYLGWTEMIFNHITMRVPGPEHHFLINPFGLHYSEVTASNLVKINLHGKIVGHSEYPVNPAGFVIHSALHAAVPNAHCIMHTHTTAGLAVASSKRGLAPTNRYAASVLGSVAYHDFEGPSVHDDEKPRLVRDLGDKHALILRNHGLLVHGPAIPDAFLILLKLERACEIQVATCAIDDGLVIPDDVLAVSYDVDGHRQPSPGARRVFQAMIRQVDKVDDSYKY